MTNLDSILKNRDITWPTKVPIVKVMVYSSSYVWKWEWDHKELWAPKNLCFWTVVLEKTLESPLDCKDIKPVNPKENQSWMFTGRTDAEAEAPILWPPDAKSWKRPWCWERLKAGGKGNNRGQDGWMASLTQLTSVWANFGRWWRTGKSGLLESNGSQRVGHDWVTEQQQNSCARLAHHTTVSSLRAGTLLGWTYWSCAPQRGTWIHVLGLEPGQNPWSFNWDHTPGFKT